MFASAVIGYIQHCVNTVTVDRHIWVFPNQKPWMNGKIKKTAEREKQRLQVQRQGLLQLCSSCPEAKHQSSQGGLQVEDQGGLQLHKQPAGVERVPAHYKLQIQQHHCNLWGRRTGGGAKSLLRPVRGRATCRALTATDIPT